MEWNCSVLFRNVHVCIVLYCIISCHIVYLTLKGFLFYMGIYFYESRRILQAFIGNLLVPLLIING